LVKCPKCGSETSEVIKTWNFPPHGTGNALRLMGLFECKKCGTRFRATVAKKEGEKGTVSIKNMVERIMEIKGEFMQTLKNLREKIKTLETERANLLIEIEKLKKAAESKISALESEVNMLREEVKSLRELLGYTEEEK
jgi:uncharacterized Zn finger protein